MSFKIVLNIDNIPDYKTFSHEIVFDDKEIKFDGLRTRVRAQAVDLLGVSDQDKQNAVLTQGPVGFKRMTIVNQQLIEQIAEKLGILKPAARVQVLEPGQMTLLHVDDLDKGYVNPVEDTLDRISFTPEEIENFNKDPRSVVRFLIMLEDSKPGQIMIFGDQIISCWTKGDVIHWDWPTVVHSTANMGFWPRPLMRISGLITEKTKRIIEHSHA